MDRLRRSFRESFRSGRRSSKDRAADTSKPQEWQADEATVRAGTCSFQVKYLGCVEVFESRGMQTCEEALKVLRSSRKRRIRGILYVSGDGLRVVDAENKGLVVDQTIEKVSFCAPDRNHDRGFAYICRDGTTRRWMCHGFHAAKESGERLSHAVGCAFAVCLERKQKRDREAATLQLTSASASASGTPLATTASAPPLIGGSPLGAPSESPSSTAPGSASSFQRHGSFRQASLTERIIDPQNVKPAEKPPLKPIVNPHAVSRPHANPQLFERQGSLRLGPNSAPTSPFRRNYSLRLNELPSNLARQQTSENGRHGSLAYDSTIAESEHEESSLDLTASAAHQTFSGATPACQLSETFPRQLSLNDSPQFASQTPHHAFENAASTSQPQSARSKADEWLESAATTARSIQQQRLSPPPSAVGNHAVITPPASKVDVRRTSATTATPTMPVLTKATSDSFSVLDSTGGARQQLVNGGATNGFTAPMVAPVAFGYQPLLDSNFVIIPTANTVPPLVAPAAPGVDVFGQPVFNGVPQHPPPVPTRSAATMPPAIGSAADPFDAKWQALGASTRTPPPPPNPFSHESSAVNI